MTPDTSPAWIIANRLINAGAVKLTGSAADFIVKAGSLPSEHDNAVAVYDTTPVLDGRIQKTGKHVVHPGIAIRARSLDYLKAYRKASECLVVLTEKTNWTEVNVDGEAYVIQSVTLTTGIIRIGEVEQRDRQNFQFNALATISLKE